VIALDFDNTIVGYNELFCGLAYVLGLVPRAVCGKGAVREHVRALWVDGEALWQRLQAAVYGHGIRRARPMPGVRRFLARCRQVGCRVYIVSHKTRFAAQGRRGVDLREAALAWMRRAGVLDLVGGTGRVFFEETRAAKIGRVTALGCTHLIDDLEEVLLDARLPAGVERLLYAPGRTVASPDGITVFASWAAIGEYLFGPVPGSVHGGWR